VAERGGLHRLLEISWTYELFQRLISRQGSERRLQAELYPELGSRPVRVLDIGCGPAAFWARYQHFADLDYVGIEPNAAYVHSAWERFPDIELHIGTTADVGDSVVGGFDLIVLEGVLHHIDDENAVATLAYAAERLVTGGRLVALDPVLLERQHPVARALALLDRGKHVRTLAGYRALAGEAFDPAETSIRRLSGQLRVPYDHAVLEAGR
jgi:SAM-dependent methyltransferase